MGIKVLFVFVVGFVSIRMDEDGNEKSVSFFLLILKESLEMCLGFLFLLFNFFFFGFSLAFFFIIILFLSVYLYILCFVFCFMYSSFFCCVGLCLILGVSCLVDGFSVGVFYFIFCLNLLFFFVVRGRLDFVSLVLYRDLLVSWLDFVEELSG